MQSPWTRLAPALASAMLMACGCRGGEPTVPPPALAPPSIPVAGTEFAVAVLVPDATWRVTIEEIHLVNGKYLVVARVHRLPMGGAQVISTARDTIKASLLPMPSVVFIYGKLWNWANEEQDYRFFKTRDALDEAAKALGKSQLAWKRPAPEGK